jgi:hypothetical protein
LNAKITEISANCQKVKTVKFEILNMGKNGAIGKIMQGRNLVKWVDGAT